MKLVSCEYKGREFAGIVRGEIVCESQSDMSTLIKCLADGQTPRLTPVARLDEVKLCSPIPVPAQDVICLGMNYRDHSAEIAGQGNGAFVRNEGKAVYFSKRAARIAGPEDYIDGHFDIVNDLDYEAELAVILGRDAYQVSREQAREYVFGYSVFNDVSARDLQKAHKQFYFGKSLDTHTVMGPWIVTADELSWPPECAVRCWVNGEKRQDGNTRNMIFDIPHIISELSRGMTLKAGTIIATGTPAGVGMGFEPPRYLKSGDIIRCEIEGVGVLQNQVR